MTWDWKKDGRRVLAVILAAALMALNIKTFVRTGDLFPGGVTGLTVLIQRLAEKFWGIQLPYSPINILLNAFPVYVGFRFVGKKFTLFSCEMILAVFGGILGGVAVSLCLYVDATSGGTDFIAIYLSQKRGVETWNLVLGFNVVILCIAGLFFGWDKALYSIIFQYVSTQTLHTLYRSYQKQTLFVVTRNAQEVCDAIHIASHHGATISDAIGSHSHSPYKLVYSVISGADVKTALQAVREADPEAFVNSIRSTEVRGNFYMRPKD